MGGTVSMHRIRLYHNTANLQRRWTTWRCNKNRPYQSLSLTDYSLRACAMWSPCTPWLMHVSGGLALQVATRRSFPCHSDQQHGCGCHASSVEAWQLTLLRSAQAMAGQTAAAAACL